MPPWTKKPSSQCFSTSFASRSFKMLLLYLFECSLIFSLIAVYYLAWIIPCQNMPASHQLNATDLNTIIISD